MSEVYAIKKSAIEYHPRDQHEPTIEMIKFSDYTALTSQLTAKDDEIKTLREALEKINKNRYGAQGYAEEGDVEGLASYWASVAMDYQDIARQALQKPKAGG